MKMKGSRTRKEPLRRCISCRQQLPKNDLLRVVRTPEEQLVFDVRGKMSGRGAYICRQKSCLDKSLKHRLFHRHLRAEPDEQLVAQLKELTGNGQQTAEPAGPGPAGGKTDSGQQPD